MSDKKRVCKEKGVCNVKERAQPKNVLCSVPHSKTAMAAGLVKICKAIILDLSK